MNFHGFVGNVQDRAKFGTLDDAVAATRATLNSLGERLQDPERKHLAAQLPEEIAHYLCEVQGGEKFGLDEFFDRVSKRESKDLPAATYHARVVCDVLQKAVSDGEASHVKTQLPADFQPLFEAGSEGKMQKE